MHAARLHLTAMLLSAVAAAFSATPVNAATATVAAFKDNTLFQSVGGTESNGAGVSFFAGRTGIFDEDHLRRAVIAFNLVGLVPGDAVVTDVTLTLFLERAGFMSGNTTVSLHGLTEDWGEGTSIGGAGNAASATAGDATWLHRFHPDAPWTTPGGEFDPIASASTVMVGANRTYSWSGARLLNDVQTWIADPAANFGWILIGDETEQNTALRFSSREAINSSLRPQLTITYTPVPEPSTLAFLACGVAAFGFRRRVGK